MCLSRGEMGESGNQILRECARPGRRAAEATATVTKPACAGWNRPAARAPLACGGRLRNRGCEFIRPPCCATNAAVLRHDRLPHLFLKPHQPPGPKIGVGFLLDSSFPVFTNQLKRALYPQNLIDCFHLLYNPYKMRMICQQLPRMVLGNHRSLPI